jgi:hypothetical protein
MGEGPELVTLPRRTCSLVRLDGSASNTYTRGFLKPLGGAEGLLMGDMQRSSSASKYKT